MEEETIVVERRPLKWGPIWGGLFVVAGVQILLMLLGLAIGVSAIEPTRGSVEGVSLWSGIWAIVSTWIAFFCGGWFAGGAGERPLRRADALRSGVALWGFALTIGMIVATAGVIGAVDLGRALLVPPGVRVGLHSGYTIGAAWATFGTVLVALGCAIGGAALGAPSAARRTRARVERPVVTAPRVPTTPSPTTP